MLKRTPLRGGGDVGGLRGVANGGWPVRIPTHLTGEESFLERELRKARHGPCEGFDLETTRVLGGALEMTCAVLRTDDVKPGGIPAKIIDLAKAHAGKK